MISYQYIICVDDKNRWSVISLFYGEKSKAMDSLQVHYPPKQMHHTFTAGTEALYELNYAVKKGVEGNEAERRNEGVELVDLSSNNFKSTYNIVTRKEKDQGISLMSVDIKHRQDGNERTIYALKINQRD